MNRLSILPGPVEPRRVAASSDAYKLNGEQRMRVAVSLSLSTVVEVIRGSLGDGEEVREVNSNAPAL